MTLKRALSLIFTIIVFVEQSNRGGEFLQTDVWSVSPLLVRSEFEMSAFESLYGGQFTLSTLLIKPNYFMYNVQCQTTFSFILGKLVSQYHIK